MKTHFFRIASAAALALTLSSCDGSNDVFSTHQATGSCLFTTTDGYDYCEDFLGTEYNQSIAQNTCRTGNGTWSLDACPAQGAIAVCAVPLGGETRNFQYTYSVASGGSAGADLTLKTETHCGLAGGTFTAR